MEVGKEQQAQARRKLAALYLPHGGQSSRLAYERAAAHYVPTADPLGRAQGAPSVNTEAVLL
jgi:hypothetical protein